LDKKSFLRSPDNQKLLTFIIGFGIVAIHFVITPMFDGASDYSITKFMLNAPSIFLFRYLSLPISDFFMSTSNTVSKFLFIINSSFFYGIMGGSLASHNTFVRLIGILLLCLLIFFGCGLYAAFVFTLG
jgi:hypothetical protein